MKKILVVVDMQNDFIDGPLGTPEARAIVDNVCAKIRESEWDFVFATYDTHEDDYLYSQEGKKLPIKHCINWSEGWKLNSKIQDEIDECKCYEAVFKETFGAVELADYLYGYYPHDLNEEQDNIELTLIGVCTDICVISNALLLKAHYPEMKIVVDAACCAGSSPEKHRMALEVMKSCQVEVENMPEDWVMFSDISEEKMDKILDVMDNYNPELCKYKSYAAGVRDTNCREDCNMKCPYEKEGSV